MLFAANGFLFRLIDALFRFGLDCAGATEVLATVQLRCGVIPPCAYGANGQTKGLVCGTVQAVLLQACGSG